MRRAVIDIGTNSVKLLVAVVDGPSVSPLFEKSHQTRLGEGFYETQRLRPESIARTAEAVAEFAEIARAWAALTIRVIATSAARDALNQAELLMAVRQASGLNVEVISGEQEADWAFAGVSSDPALAQQALLILDVGGGSTEFILGHGSRQAFRKSFPLGVVRLLEQMPFPDPPRATDWQQCRAALSAFLDAQVRPALRAHYPILEQQSLRVVATGGTSTILAAMELRLSSFEREKIEKAVLTFARVQEFRIRLWSLRLEQRRAIPGLPPNRADVILFGVAILEAIMESFSLPRLHVSTRGLRFGAVAAAPADCPA